MTPIMRQILNKQGKINPKVLALKDRLQVRSHPACLLIQGDSTANENTEWFYLTMQWLAAKYPAYTFTQRLWDDVNQNYSGAISYIQTGVAGDAYATVTGGSSIYLDDAVALRITGDIEVIVKVAATDWTPATAQLLASKFGSAGNRGWALGLATDGTLYWWWSADGTNLLGGAGTAVASSAKVSDLVANGSPIWIKSTFDVDNGAVGYDVKYYTSTDGTTWTQLGTTKTGVGTTSFYASTAALHIGKRADGTAFEGKIYKAIIKSGIGGKIIASPDLGMAFPASVTTFEDAENNTWKNNSSTWGNGSPVVMVLNSSHPGAAIAYSTDETRFALQTPIEPQLAFINYGHNNGDPTGFQSLVDGLCTQILTAYSNAGIIGVTQNPQTAPRTAEQIAAHLSTQRQVVLAMQAKGYGLIDAYKIMNSSPTTYTSGDDGVHPVAVGSQMWATTVEKYLKQSGKM